MRANPNNYDAWFDYLRLVEADADMDTIREVYERAISNIPPVQVLRFLLKKFSSVGNETSGNIKLKRRRSGIW